MKALIIIIVIGLLILAAAIWADTALAQVSPDCYRQEPVYSWTENQTITTFSVLHVKPNGKPAEGCGGIAKTDLYKWREYYELGSKCWVDLCINNSIMNSGPNGRLVYSTTVQTRNGYKLLRLGIYNVINGH